MSRLDYEGNTFVAFMDISGFSKLVENSDGDKALRVLDRFYTSGFKILEKSSNRNPIVKGTFVSDCGVLFAKSKGAATNNINVLKKMLKIIEYMNKELIKDNCNIMLTSSIAYGLFSYQERKFILEKIIKQFICGSPYLNAYRDNSKSTPRIRPGECRILIDGNLPDDVKSHIDASMNDRSDRFSRGISEDKNHYYYYWMCNSSKLIDEYKLKYDSIYKEILKENDSLNRDERQIDEKYSELSMLIKSYSNI